MPIRVNLIIGVCKLLKNALPRIMIPSYNVVACVLLALTHSHTNFFGELGGTNRLITKNRYNRNFDTPFEICSFFFFSFKTICDMSCHLLTKLELKAKTSVAQTGSQPYVHAKGLSEMTVPRYQVTVFCNNKLTLFISLNSGPYRPGIAEPRAKDYPPPANVGQMERPNDCEIIVVNKNQR
jgi:hypothetical protein